MQKEEGEVKCQQILKKESVQNKRYGGGGEKNYEKIQSRIEGQKRGRQLFHAIGVEGGGQGNGLKAHFENCAFIEF